MFQKTGLEIFQNFHEIFKYFKVKYFIVHPFPNRSTTIVSTLPCNVTLPSSVIHFGFHYYLNSPC